jgi:hypothetical protein
MAATSTPAPSPTVPPSQYRAQLLDSGYLVLPSLLPPTLLAPLRAACAHATGLARSGSWPYIRTLPKQFPPWPSDPSAGIWGVQHLLHPSMASQPLFAASYFSGAVAAVVARLMECPEQELVMELYNLLVRPERDFELRWHRDDVPPEATTAEEERRLGGDMAQGRERVYSHAQWNLALYDDESLVVVPRSHRRARTQAERDAGPYEREMEGAVVVKLRAGDVVFYDNNILHRGVYKADKERMTLHGSMGRSGHGDERARNVLQHGVGDWVAECDFSALEEGEEGMGKRAEAMRTNLMEMGKGRGEVEYSQPD